MQPLVKHHNALLMANHGAVAYGADLWQAWDRLETLEHTAKIAILSRVLRWLKESSGGCDREVDQRAREGRLSRRVSAWTILRLSESIREWRWRKDLTYARRAG